MVEGGAAREELGSTLSSLPCQLSADDIEDFFSLAKYYASRTPQSFRKVRWLSGSMYTSHTVCYCIGLPQLAVWKWAESDNLGNKC